jgi:hypothetical protein
VVDLMGPWLNCLRKIHLAAQPVERPVTRIQNTNIPVIEGSAYSLFFVVSVGYLGVFIAGWNFSIPTRRETILWRATTVTALSSALAVFISMQMSFSRYTGIWRKLRLAASQNEEAKRAPSNATTANNDPKRKHNAIGAFATSLKNNSLLKDPALDAPVEAIIATWFLGFFYCVARAYIADLMELRPLPRSSYQAVNWSTFWPHLLRMKFVYAESV